MFNQRFLYAALTSTLAIFFHINALAQSEDRSETIKEILSLRKELNEKEESFLSPSDEDREAFAEFLKQPETGLIRLLPRGLYKDKLTIRGGGAYYSFTHLTHQYGGGSDIELQPVPTNDYVAPPFAEHIFMTGFAGADYGFIVNLGNVPIEKVTLDHKGIEFLANYEAQSAEPQARAEFRRASFGIGKNRYQYNIQTFILWPNTDAYFNL